MNCNNLIEPSKEGPCSDITLPGINTVYYCDSTGNVYDELGNFLGIGELSGKSLNIKPGEEKKSKIRAFLKSKNA